jgi:2-polyprenyl-3-methyl-5-hydroxy-6-metoxy-1,4-benzoquinol methylase
MDDKEYFEINRGLWNGLTEINFGSKFYDVDVFIKGKSSLNYVELDTLGDVNNKSLLHLQCHFGMDTLSWARMGAKVTGVDLSDKAITRALQLNEAIGTNARFVNSDIYSLPDNLNEKFDIVFTSYGVIGWLPDLDKWAKVIAHFLNPGGTFFMAEFHPFLFLWDDNYEKLKYPYFNYGVLYEISKGSYADWDADFTHDSREWCHTLSEVFTALTNAGLKVTEFEEYPFSFYNCFHSSVQGDDGFWRIKGMEGKLPLMFSVKAVN